METFIDSLIYVWPLFFAAAVIAVIAIVKMKLEKSHSIDQWREGFFVGILAGLTIGIGATAIVYLIICSIT